MKLVTKWCKGCGKIMRDVQPNKRYCEKCLHDKNVKNSRERYRKKKARNVEALHKEAISLPHRPRSIAWCVREAEKRHMSYGQFVGLGLDKEALA